MQRNPSAQFEEIVFAREGGKSFLKLYCPPTAVQMTNAVDRGATVVSQRGELTLHIRNTGLNQAYFAVFGAVRSHPAEDASAYAQIGDPITVVPGGRVSVTIPDGPENLLSLVGSVVSPEFIPTTLRISGLAWAPWTVWKQDDQQDRAVVSLDHFLSDEEPDPFYAGVWPSNAS